MEPQDLAGRELQAIKRRLCYISSTVCALCLVSLATTLALFLSLCTHHQSQTQDKCPQYPCRSTTYAQLKWCAKKNSSHTVMWKEGIVTNEMQVKDGNLIILSSGLYFINCRLHFLIHKCVQDDEDIYTYLLVNGRPVYEVLNTVSLTNRSACRVYREEHFSLHIQLNASDKLSVNTSFSEWLNNETLSDSIVFEVFRV